MLDPEEVITINTPGRIRVELSFGNEVPPRLIFRTLEWCEQEILRAGIKIEAAKAALTN